MNIGALVVIVIVALFLLYFMFGRKGLGLKCGGLSGSTGGCGCGGGGSTGGGTGSSCFSGVDFHVKGGLFDLRNCTDDVYIFGDRTRVHFITEQP